MPYVKPERREILDTYIHNLSRCVRDDGELNYCITRLVLRFLKHIGLNYANLARVVGTLKLVSTELERRVIGPYEDRKKSESGDVLEFQELQAPL